MWEERCATNRLFHLGWPFTNDGGYWWWKRVVNCRDQLRHITGLLPWGLEYTSEAKAVVIRYASWVDIVFADSWFIEWKNPPSPPPPVWAQPYDVLFPPHFFLEINHANFHIPLSFSSSVIKISTSKQFPLKASKGWQSNTLHILVPPFPYAPGWTRISDSD